MPSVSLPDEVRDGCAWVTSRARSVRIDEGKIEAYAAELARAVRAAPAEEPPGTERDPEAAAAFAICMNAINFGSGWWPTIRKRPGLSGYSTMEAGVTERFDSGGPWSAEELVTINASEIAAVVGQDPGHPLMEQFAAALRDVGAHLENEHEGRYFSVVEKAQSVPGLAEIFASWKSFADVSEYDGRKVPFFKRAQLAAADLKRAAVADLPGFDRLTAFADNLVPHVLRVDGVLTVDQKTAQFLDKNSLVLHGSPREVEMRASAVQGVELISAACGIPPAEIDNALWNRGRDRRYKSIPRPRSRNTAY